jgi:hypothetical protein
LKFGLIMLCYLTRIKGYQCYVFQFCLRVFLINSGHFSKYVKNWSKSVCFWELKIQFWMMSFAIKFSKLNSLKILEVLDGFFWKSNCFVYSLVCNMWKVHTRPTSASDFFILFFVLFSIEDTVSMITIINFFFTLPSLLSSCWTTSSLRYNASWQLENRYFITMTTEKVYNAKTKKCLEAFEKSQQKYWLSNLMPTPTQNSSVGSNADLLPKGFGLESFWVLDNGW